MGKDKSDKSPSADEIIEALAQEMGVEEDGDAYEADTDSQEEPEDEVAAAEADDDDDEPAKPAPPPAPKAKKGEGAKAKAAKAAPAAPKAKKAAKSEHHVEEDLDQDHGLDAIFNTSGKEGDAYVDSYYGGEDDYTPGRRGRTIVALVIVAVVSAGGLAAAYLAIPEDKRTDVPTLAKCYVPFGTALGVECVDIQEQRARRRAEEEERRRIAWLESLPKYGSLSVGTRPGYSFFTVDDLPTYVAHPNQDGVLVETRSGTSVQNLDVTVPHVATITLNNYQERRMVLTPFGQADSLWQQRQDNGDYFLELNELLEPEPDRAAELMMRMNPTPETPELTGSITVSTDPPGARVFYNGQLLTAEDAATPLLTPVTFNTYRPAPRQPDPESGQTEPIIQEPIPISLSSQGIPIRVELDGYMPVVTGVYRHMFLCDVDQPPPADVPFWPNFWEHCTYHYETGTIDLMTPEEFSPPEPAAEGTGGAAPTEGSSPG
jgi:hypothetical protein